MILDGTLAKPRHVSTAATEYHPEREDTRRSSFGKPSPRPASTAADPQTHASSPPAGDRPPPARVREVTGLDSC